MSSCTKTRFSSRRAAKNGAAAVARPNGDRRMPVYFCKACNGWHLTSRIGRTV